MSFSMKKCLPEFSYCENKFSYNFHYFSLNNILFPNLPRLKNQVLFREEKGKLYEKTYVHGERIQVKTSQQRMQVAIRMYLFSSTVFFPGG